jgi:hypothetical protein
MRKKPKKMPLRLKGPGPIERAVKAREQKARKVKTALPPRKARSGFVASASEAMSGKPKAAKPRSAKPKAAKPKAAKPKAAKPKAAKTRSAKPKTRAAKATQIWQPGTPSDRNVHRVSPSLDPDDPTVIILRVSKKSLAAAYDEYVD